MIVDVWPSLGLCSSEVEKLGDEPYDVTGIHSRNQLRPRLH
jgi:hypothetical protein